MLKVKGELDIDIILIEGFKVSVNDYSYLAIAFKKHFGVHPFLQFLISSSKTLGLLKLASYHKSRGDTVELVRDNTVPSKNPDIIYITSLFTWGMDTGSFLSQVLQDPLS
jgi:hypothetical protein